jgi:diguanylate cyclase (GGDEF)-like protein
MVIKHYIWLFSIVVFSIWQSTQIAFWPVAWHSLLSYSLYIVVAIGIFISLWLNRIQPFLVLLSIGLLNGLLTYFAAPSEMNLSSAVLFPILAFLLPLNLLLWILLPEKGIYNKRFDIAVLSVFIVQGIAIYWLMTDLSLQWVEPLSLRVIEGSQVIQLPFASSLMFLLAGFVLSFKLRYHRFKVLYHAVVVILLLMAYGLNAFFQPGILAWFSMISATIIIFSVIFDSHHIAYTDELTGIMGRRALYETFLGLGRKYSIAMVDIDHFKSFNDTYGHDIGDEVLRTVASILNTVSGGRAYRYGGEEFALVFAGKTAAESLPELERLRAAIAAESLEFIANGKPVQTQVKISIGLAENDKIYKVPEAVLKFADEGLYKAKKTGRNKVVESLSPPNKVNSRSPRATAKAIKANNSKAPSKIS